MDPQLVGSSSSHEIDHRDNAKEVSVNERFCAGAYWYMLMLYVCKAVCTLMLSSLDISSFGNDSIEGYLKFSGLQFDTCGSLEANDTGAFANFDFDLKLCETQDSTCVGPMPSRYQADGVIVDSYLLYSVNTTRLKQWSDAKALYFTSTLLCCDFLHLLQIRQPQIRLLQIHLLLIHLLQIHLPQIHLSSFRFQLSWSHFVVSCDLYASYYSFDNMSSKTIILEFVFVTIFQLNSEEYKVPLNQLYFRRMVYWKLVLQQFSSRSYFLSHVLSKLASDVVNLYGLTYGLFVSKFGHGMKCIFSKVAFPKSYNRIWEGSLVILIDHIVKFYGRTKLSLSKSQQKFPGFGIKYVFFVSLKNT